MKTKNHHLTPAAITAILSVLVLINVSLPLEDEPEAILIGRPFPQLAGIEALYFSIAMPEAESKKHSLTLKEMKGKVEKKLQQAGIALIPQFDNRRQITSPALRADIDMLKLEGNQQYVFRIQTSLARTVALQAKPNLHFHADVWKQVSQMHTVPIRNMPAAITKIVLEQVDVFIADYLAANPPDKRPADANEITAVLPVIPVEKTTPLVKPATAQYQYVASKNSKVFHNPDCRWAKRIKPANLVTFSTRDKATQAGKRPCKICKP